MAALPPPALRPLRFTEVVAFRDFGPADLSSPKGAAYHRGLNRVLVSISPNAPGRVQILKTVAPDGRSNVFSPGYRPFRDVEAFIAVVPPDGAPVAAGFTPGDVFVGRGPGGEISRINQAGTLLSDIWVDLQSAGLWGGLTIDTVGGFGGRLVAMTLDGKIYLVTAQGTATLFKDVGRRVEGIAVAPNTFGPLGGRLVYAVEGYDDDDPQSGKLYAIDASGNQALVADIGYAAEDIQFVPPNGGTYYQCQLAFDRERENRLLAASSSQFLGRLGHMIVPNEMTGDIYTVAWDGAAYRVRRAGRIPGRWSSQGFRIQGTELEAGCFAARPPSLPTWSAWSLVPGGGTTDRAPAVVRDSPGNLHLLVKGINDQRVYLNNMWVSGPEAGTWTGWQEVPGGLTTNHAPAAAMHNEVVLAFAVRGDGVVMHKRLFGPSGPPTADPWVPVPGNLTTDTAVAATIANGRLVLAAKAVDGQLHLNELQPGGRGLWTGWSGVPDGGSTNAAPGLASFQDDLYLFIKGLTTNRILLKSRLVDDAWTDYAELPGAGLTDNAPSAIAMGGQLYVFVKGLATDPFINVASDTGTWSGWAPIADGFATDAALAATAIGNRAYLFARRAPDGQLGMRNTV